MKRLFLVGFISVLFFTFVKSSIAEDAGKKKKVIENKKEVSKLAEVVVTGTKIDKKIENMTDTVTVVTEDEIDKNSFTDFTEILRFTPGVEFKQAGGPGQFNYPKLRGFGQGHFLVVIDGIKVNEGMSGGVSNLFSHLDPEMIERIEILRGPQAALYGSNTTAGVIVITTKKGKKGIKATVGGEGGSLSWRKGYASLRGAMENFNYALYAGYTDSNGVHKYEYFKDRTFNINLGYEFNNSFNASGGFMYTRSEFNFAELRESYAKDSPSTPWWSFQLPDKHSKSLSHYYNGHIKLNHKINDLFEQKLTLGYYRHKKEGLDRNDGYLGSVLAPYDNFTLDYAHYYNKGEQVPVYDKGDGKPYYYDNKNFLADYNFIWNQALGFLGSNTLLLGAEYQKQKGEKWGKYGELRKKVKIYSFYMNDQILLLDDSLVFSIGVRNDHHEEFGNDTTWKTGLSYTFRQTGTTLFTNYGTSFKAPTFFNLYDPRYGNKDLDPEEGETYEFGIRQSLFNKRVKLEATYWHTKLDDVITFVYGINPDPTIIGMYDNRDQAITKGVETSLTVLLTDTLTFKGNYTYCSSKSRKNGESFRTPQIARNKFNLDLSYDIPRFHLNIHEYYSGPRLRWRGDKKMSSYFRTDIAAKVDITKNWGAYARVENVFDEHIEEGLGYEQPGVYAVAGLEFKYQ